jgi:hypothetical protein
MKFVNRAKHLVFLPLKSGDTVHLAPGEVSASLESHEVELNPRLDRLVQLGVVAPVAEAPAERKGSARSRTEHAD